MTQPFFHAPSIVLWLIVALIAAHAFRVLAPEPWPELLLVEFALIPARISEASFFSHVFVHADSVHLAVNCVSLLAFGPIVAKRVGAWNFVLFFLLCAAAAGIAQSIAAFGAFDLIVGASGGACGVMGAAVRVFYGRIYYASEQPAPLLSSPIIGFSALQVVANLIAGATGFGLTDPAQSVAWVAHLAGYFAGLSLIGVRRGFRAAPTRALARPVTSGAKTGIG